MPDQPKTPPARATTRPAQPEQILDPTPDPAPEPAVSEPVPEPPGIPTAPMLPNVFTPVTIATYVGSLAVFIVGVLVLCGVPIPAHVSAEVQTITGSIVSAVGAIVPLIALASHHSVQRAALTAGVPLEQVVSIRG